MLDQARQASRQEPPEVTSRLNYCLLEVNAAAQAFAPAFFDAVTCHTLIEYLPDPRSTLASLASLLRGGGLLSLSFVNRHAEILRQVWSRSDPAGALDRLDSGAFCAKLFGLQGLAYTGDEVSAWLTDLGLEVTSMCGVRALADQAPREQLEDPAFYKALLRLEKAVSARKPYHLIARYVHLLAHKPTARDEEPAPGQPAARQRQ
jgi:S-adenosylmethionine-dependent methyltransferase